MTKLNNGRIIVGDNKPKKALKNTIVAGATIKLVDGLDIMMTSNGIRLHPSTKTFDLKGG